MTSETSADMGQHTRVLTAMFDSREDANEAIERLVELGIPRNNCRLVEGETTSQSSSTSSGASYAQGGGASAPGETKGFWDSLADLFMPDEDRYTYAEGLRRGGYLLTVNVTDAQYDDALDILDDEGTINIDEREQTWRQEGWTGWDESTASQYRTGSGTMGAGQTTGTSGTGQASSGIAGSGEVLTGIAGSGQTTGHQATTTQQTTSQQATGQGAMGREGTGREETIPIVEEQLQVGKREVEGGRVRVRSYVVEQPVQEQVTLRDEKVSVERKPVDRPISGTEDAFRERTIEADERREEAVVNKQARVKEEVVVRKDAQQRTETVSDKVRRTEVEVDDQTKGKPGTRKGERGAG